MVQRVDKDIMFTFQYVYFLRRIDNLCKFVGSKIGLEQHAAIIFICIEKNYFQFENIQQM